MFEDPFGNRRYIVDLKDQRQLCIGERRKDADFDKFDVDSIALVLKVVRKRERGPADSNGGSHEEIWVKRKGS